MHVVAGVQVESPCAADTTARAGLVHELAALLRDSSLGSLQLTGEAYGSYVTGVYNTGSLLDVAITGQIVRNLGPGENAAVEHVDVVRLPSTHACPACSVQIQCLSGVAWVSILVVPLTRGGLRGHTQEACSPAERHKVLEHVVGALEGAGLAVPGTIVTSYNAALPSVRSVAMPGLHCIASVACATQAPWVVVLFVRVRARARHTPHD